MSKTPAEVKVLVENLILDVLEFSSSFCMDSKEEREALADALTVDLVGRFRISPKPKRHATTVIAKIE